MTQRVLVIGASGFLGGNILRALAAAPDTDVIVACRDRRKLPAGFSDTARVGDLTDPEYRRNLVKGIDTICYAGGYASMWGHAREEQERFFLPALDLLDRAVASGVGRFILASTVAVSPGSWNATPIADNAPSRSTGFWPHLDRLIALESAMRARAGRGTGMVTLRLGHFVGAGNRIGLVPALVPRLKTHLVPWLGRGNAPLPLISGDDLGRAFAAAVQAVLKDEFAAFNICGREFPTLREVIDFIACTAGVPRPHYGVPYTAGYAFGALMEAMPAWLPGRSPFLTRSIVHLCEPRRCATVDARERLGFVPTCDWRVAIREQLEELRVAGFPWPALFMDTHTSNPPSNT